MLNHEAASLDIASDGSLLLSGGVDLASVEALYEQGRKCIERCGEVVTIDCRRASFRGAGGLSLLVSWIKCGLRSGRSVRFEHAPESLLRIADAYGMAEVLGLGPASIDPGDGPEDGISRNLAQAGR